MDGMARNETRLNHLTLLVNDKPYRLWDQDWQRRTTEFLDSIDPAFFSYLAEVHAGNLESDDHRRRAATAARMTYLHGVETFLTLAAAAVQAPCAPYAWVSLAQTKQLRGVIERISKGDRTLHTGLSNWDYTWAGLAKDVFAYCPQENGWPATAESFGRAWRTLADEFLNVHNQDEYNSLKHGFRIRSTGVKIAAGLETQPGLPAPPEAMQLVGGSDTGSTFYSLERVHPDIDDDRNRRSRRCTVNWAPETSIRGLQVIDVSIRNIIAFLRILHGARPSSVQIHRLEGVNDVDALLFDSISVRYSSFDFDLDESHIPLITKKQLLEEFARDAEHKSSGSLG